MTAVAVKMKATDTERWRFSILLTCMVVQPLKRCSCCQYQWKVVLFLHEPEGLRCDLSKKMSSKRFFEQWLNYGLKDWHPTARSLCSPNLGYACLRALKPRPARYLLAFDFFQMWNKKRTTSCTSASTVNRSFFVSYSSFGKVATFYPAFNSLLPPPPGLKLVFLFLFVSFFL